MWILIDNDAQPDESRVNVIIVETEVDYHPNQQPLHSM